VHCCFCFVGVHVIFCSDNSFVLYDAFVAVQVDSVLLAAASRDRGAIAFMPTIYKTSYSGIMKMEQSIVVDTEQ
jgi:hypothetical protein